MRRGTPPLLGAGVCAAALAAGASPVAGLELVIEVSRWMACFFGGALIVTISLTVGEFLIDGHKRRDVRPLFRAFCALAWLGSLSFEVVLVVTRMIARDQYSFRSTYVALCALLGLIGLYGVRETERSTKRLTIPRDALDALEEALRDSPCNDCGKHVVASDFLIERVRDSLRERGIRIGPRQTDLGPS